MKFVILVYFQKSVAKIQVGINLTRIIGTPYEHVCTFVILSRPLPEKCFRQKFLRKSKYTLCLVDYFLT